ncbi:Glutamate receptor U1 [Anthophora quadrimaculata]
MGDRRDILVSEDKSWITNENFRLIIDSTFSTSGCCNVFLSDSMKDSKALFSQFRSIYPYEYHLKRSTYECDGYFLLGSSDNEIMESMEKVSSLLWKTEILIIVNNNVSNNSSILNNSIYGIANVNIVSISGTWKLSANYLKPRGFVTINRYEEMRRGNSVNFRGRELQVCSIYRPPMTYLNHTIVKTINGEQAEVFVMDNDMDWNGIETRLFLIMAEKLNFTWTIRKPEGGYTYGRRVNETIWKGGMIEMLREKKVDMAFASIWLTMDQNTFVHLSEPWYQVHLHFLVPRPRRTTSFWALSRPFSGAVWCLLLSALFLHCFYTYVRAWIDPKFPKKFRNFLITLTDLIGCLLSSSVPRACVTNKLQILLWQTAGWLIITAYCSSLAARLSSSDYENRIDTVEQFLAANLSWGNMGQVPPFRDYFDLTNPYSSQLPSKYRYIKNSTQLKKLIVQGDYAILGKIVGMSFFPDDYVSNDDLKNYRLMKQPVGNLYAAFAIQPWLLEPINRIMLYLKETGITIWHLRDVIRSLGSYNLHEVLVEHDGYDGNVQVLGLTPLGAGFSLLLVGSSIASLVFYLELKHAAAKTRSSSVRKLLREINRKREFFRGQDGRIWNHEISGCFKGFE